MAGAVAAGGGVSAVGNIIQGQVSKGMANSQADIADQNANEAMAKAAVDEQRQRIRSRMVIGSDRAGYGAAGVSSAEGSALEVLSSSAAQGEFDAQMIRHNGAIQALNYRNESAMLRYQGRQAEIGSFFGGASSLLLSGAKGQQMGTSDTSGGGYGSAGGSYSDFSNVS